MYDVKHDMNNGAYSLDKVNGSLDCVGIVGRQANILSVFLNTDDPVEALADAINLFEYKRRELAPSIENQQFVILRGILDVMTFVVDCRIGPARNKIDELRAQIDNSF